MLSILADNGSQLRMIMRQLLNSIIFYQFILLSMFCESNTHNTRVECTQGADDNDGQPDIETTDCKQHNHLVKQDHSRDALAARTKLTISSVQIDQLHKSRLTGMENDATIVEAGVFILIIRCRQCYQKCRRNYLRCGKNHNNFPSLNTYW